MDYFLKRMSLYYKYVGKMTEFIKKPSIFVDIPELFD